MMVSFNLAYPVFIWNS